MDYMKYENYSIFDCIASLEKQIKDIANKVNNGGTGIDLIELRSQINNLKTQVNNTKTEINSQLKTITKLINPSMSLEEVQNILDLGGDIKIIDGVYNWDCTPVEMHPNGLYAITGKLLVRDNTNLFISKKAYINVTPSSNGAYTVFMLKGVKNVKIQGGNLIGDLDNHIGTDGQCGYGISLLDSEHITIKDVNITKMWGDGINLQKLTTTNKDINMYNCNCIGNRRQGLSIEDGSDIYALRCKFNDTEGHLPQSGVDLEPSTSDSLVNNVTFEECEFNGNAKNGIVLDGTYGKVTNIKIKNCIGKENKNATALLIYKAENVIVDNNKLTGTNETGNTLQTIYVNESNDVRIYDNNIKKYGIGWRNSQNCYMNNNEIILDDLPSVVALKFENCVGGDIKGNNIINNTGDVLEIGLQVFNSCKNINISKNNISKAKKGCVITNCENINLTNNDISKHSMLAVEISGTSTNPSKFINIKDNVFEYCCYNNNGQSFIYNFGYNENISIINNDFIKIPKDGTSLGNGYAAYSINISSANTINSFLIANHKDYSLAVRNVSTVGTIVIIENFPKFGSSSTRPSYWSAPTGHVYFDTDLKKPLTCVNSDGWYDSTGTKV